jgi:hypothetical protein
VAIAVVGGRKRAEAAALAGLDLAGALETHFETG